MILEKSFANRSRTTATHPALAFCMMVLLSCATGCASSGTLQPHQAFRQATTPYQGYYQGMQPTLGAAGGFDSGAASNFAGYGGYNNSLPGQGQGPGQGQYNPAAPANGAYGQSFGQAYGQNFGQSFGQTYGQSSKPYPPYTPPAGYNYQPAYSGGFSSGSC